MNSKGKKMGYIAAVVSVLVYIIWSFWFIAQYPYVGVDVQQNSAGQWVVKLVERGGIGYKQGVQKGDIIEQVNGRETGLYWAVIRQHSLVQADSFTVAEGERSRIIPVEKGSGLDYVTALSLGISLFSVLTACVVYKKVRRFRSSRYLSLIFLDIALLFTSISVGVRGAPMAKFLVCGGVLITPVLFYWFLLVFMEEKAGIRLSAAPIKVLYVFLPVLMIQAPFHFYNSSLSYPILQITRLSVLALASIGVGYILLVLLRLYRQNREKRNNVYVLTKMVFISLLLSLAPVVLGSFIPKVLFKGEWLDSFYMSWFVFLFPVSFIYLIFTRRLYDMDVIMRRWGLTLAVAFIPSLLFMGIAKLLIGEISSGKLISLFIILLLGSSFILYSLENLTAKLEPVLFPRKHRLQRAMKKITRNLGNISSFRDMQEIILVDLVNTLEVVGAAIVFEYKDHVEVIHHGELTGGEVKELLATGALYEAASPYTCFEIAHQNDYSSLLVVAPKSNGTLPGQEESSWLQIIITYLAVSLENVQLIRKLDGRIEQLASLIPEEEEANNLIWFRKLMFELQEKERFRIATDLHDTTMQDLFFLKGRLQTMQSKYELPHDATLFLKSMTDYIDVINSGLRQSCFELNPHLLREIGLIPTLNKLFQSERPMVSFQIYFISSDEAEIEGQDMELKRHVFRIVQELLTNAKKYADASVLRFSICIQQGRLYLEYVDDGIGFDAAQPREQEITSSSVGLKQIKSRVLSLGGIYKLKTAVGEGVHFEASLPVKAAQPV